MHVAVCMYLLEGARQECDSRQALPTRTAWWAGSAVQQLAQSRCFAPSVSGHATEIFVQQQWCLKGCTSLQVKLPEGLGC